MTQNDIDKIIAEYSNDYYSIYDSNNVGINIDIAHQYLQNYFLSEEEYFKYWKPIQKKVFPYESIGIPTQMFSENYNLITSVGGVLFEKEDFELLQKCILEIGDRSIIIIQNDFTRRLEKPILRMKYPSDITWEKIMSGSFISTVLFKMYANEYFVFSESGLWGKYSANDEEYPLDIVGVTPDLEFIFEKYRSLFEK